MFSKWWWQRQDLLCLHWGNKSTLARVHPGNCKTIVNMFVFLFWVWGLALAQYNLGNVVLALTVQLLIKDFRFFYFTQCQTWPGVDLVFIWPLFEKCWSPAPSFPQLVLVRSMSATKARFQLVLLTFNPASEFYPVGDCRTLFWPRADVSVCGPWSGPGASNSPLWTLHCPEGCCFPSVCRPEPVEVLNV